MQNSEIKITSRLINAKAAIEIPSDRAFTILKSEKVMIGGPLDSKFSLL